MLGYFAYQAARFGRQFLIFFRTERLFQLGDIAQQQRLVMQYDRDDMVHGQISQDAGFDLYFLDIDFPFHFVAGFQLLFAQYACFPEHADYFRLQVSVVLQWNAVFVIQAAAGSFRLPFVAVTVAVETDGFGFFDISLQCFEDSHFLALACCLECFHVLLELL